MLKHIRIKCHILNETERTIRFVKDHRKELIDAINESCAIAQALLNSGTSVVVAEVRKDSNDEIFWGLEFGYGSCDKVLMKHDITTYSDFDKNTFLWSLVMEKSINDPAWNDHYYSDPLPYDNTSEIKAAIELIRIHAEP